MRGYDPHENGVRYSRSHFVPEGGRSKLLATVVCTAAAPAAKAGAKAVILPEAITSECRKPIRLDAISPQLQMQRQKARLGKPAISSSELSALDRLELRSGLPQL